MLMLQCSKLILLIKSNQLPSQQPQLGKLQQPGSVTCVFICELKKAQCVLQATLDTGDAKSDRKKFNKMSTNICKRSFSIHLLLIYRAVMGLLAFSGANNFVLGEKKYGGVSVLLKTTTA